MESPRVYGPSNPVDDECCGKEDRDPGPVIETQKDSGGESHQAQKILLLNRESTAEDT
jgi:hypothetical protein